jgi:hypothetical protein
MRILTKAYVSLQNQIGLNKRFVDTSAPQKTPKGGFKSLLEYHFVWRKSNSCLGKLLYASHFV